MNVNVFRRILFFLGLFYREEKLLVFQMSLV